MSFHCVYSFLRSCFKIFYLSLGKKVNPYLKLRRTLGYFLQVYVDIQ